MSSSYQRQQMQEDFSYPPNSFDGMSALVSDETAFLRDQLANCSRLLKYSLKANRPFDS